MCRDNRNATPSSVSWYIFYDTFLTTKIWHRRQCRDIIFMTHFWRQKYDTIVSVIWFPLLNHMSKKYADYAFNRVSSFAGPMWGLCPNWARSALSFLVNSSMRTRVEVHSAEIVSMIFIWCIRIPIMDEARSAELLAIIMHSSIVREWGT